MLGGARPIEPESTRASPAPSPLPRLRDGEGLRDTVARLERELVTSALAENDYNWAAAGRVLGMDRGNLARLAKRLGLPGDKRSLRAMRPS